MHKITRGQMHASKHTITRGQFYASTRGYLRNDKGCKKNQQNDHVIIVFRFFCFFWCTPVSARGYMRMDAREHNG